MNLLVALILLEGVFGDFALTTVNSMVDPDRVTWWRTKWAASPIQLSANNRGRTGVSVAFYLSPTTALASGVAEIVFPTGFTVASQTGQTVDGLTVQVLSQNFAAGQDYIVTVKGVTNPTTSGPYGPFAIRTRYKPGGQQVDVNLHFGSVYICGDPMILGSLSVSFAGASIKNAINKSSNTLSFKFTISVSLWRFDTFIVTVDNRWTVASGVSCSSADYTGKTNNFNGTNAANPHALQCVTSSKTDASSQQVFVYGLAASQIDVSANTDNKYVDLRISGVTTPGIVHPGHPYQWTVQTVRFGTATILETASLATGPEVVADSIAAAVWTPTWGGNAADLPPTSSTFMDLSFSTTNKVPATGTIEIVVSEDVATGDAAWAGATNCYIVVSLSRSVVCTVTAPSTLTLTNLPELAAGTLIKVRNIVKVTSANDATAKVSSIRSFGAGGIAGNLLIDSGSNLASFKVAPNTSAQIATFAVVFQDSTSTTSAPMRTAGGTGNYKQGVQFVAIPSTISDVTSSTAFTISCPLSITVGDFTIGVPSSDFYIKDSSVPTADDMCTGLTALTANKPTITPGNGAAALGSISFTGAISAFASGVHLLVSQPSTATSFITLPRVVNNLATAYECRILVQTSGKTTHRGAVRFTVTAQQWASKAFSLPCATLVDGVPATFALKPAVLPLPASSNAAVYYVEFEFPGTAGMNSGLALTPVSTPNKEDPLNFAVNYPVDKSISDSLTAKVYTDGASTFVAITGFPQWLPTAAEDTVIYFPIGGMALGVNTPTVRSYYISASDARYKFITHEEQMNAITTQAAATPTPFPLQEVIATSNTLTSGETITTNLIFNLKVSNVLAVPHYFYFILPPGFSWSNNRAVVYMDSTDPANVVNVQYTSVKYFSSPTLGFKFPGALVSAVVGSTVYSFPDSGNTMPQTLSFGGLQASLASGTQSLVAVFGAAATTADCGNLSSSVLLQTSPGTIKSLSISPATSKSRGPDGVATKHTVTFTLQHTVPASGNISLTLASDWSTTVYSSCTATGLTSPTGGSPVCTIVNRTVTITGFTDTTPATSVSVQVTNLLPPVAASGTSPTLFLVGLSSSTGTAIIDAAATFTGCGVTVTASSAISRTEWQKKTTVPMTAGVSSVDLYLRFTFPHAIPRYGLITITSPLTLRLTGNLKNACFLSPLQYSDCSVVSGNVQITVDQDYSAKVVLELYLDSAVDNPATTTPTSTGFVAKTTWAGVTIDADSGSIQSSQTFTASALLTTTMTPQPTPGFWVVPTTSGEPANYTFSFNDTVKYSTGDQYLIEFPSEYDYFLGDATRRFDNETSVYFLDCYSQELGDTLCRVDHGVVAVKGSNVLTAGSVVSVLLCGVVNPGPMQTGTIKVYHVDTNGNYKAVNVKYATVTPTVRPGNIDVISLTQSDRRLYRSCDFKWRLTITDVFNSDSLLKVWFPAEFDLSTVDKKTSYQCSTTWADSSSTGKSLQSWNSAASCSTEGNWVTLPGPLFAATFTPSQIVTWDVLGVGNPQWARNRTAVSSVQDFDITDASLWPLDPQWSGNFHFFVYRNSTNAFTSRSYPNMNSAYAGFQKPRRSIYVNFYEPLSRTNRIVVYAGTQTKDVYITTASASQPLAAKQLRFSPLTNSRTPDSGKLKYTSAVSDWVMLQSEWSIQFRVAAAIDAKKGLYYIDWTVTETRETGLTDNQYDPPVNTLVEVIPKSPASYWFTIASITSVTTGYTSVPIRVGVTNPPNSDVTVNMSIKGSPANMTISPFSLKFTADVEENYFQIQVGTVFTNALTQTVLFALTGTDASVYKIPSTISVNVVVSSSAPSPGSVLNWGFSQSTRTSISVTPITDQVGVIYYFLSAAGSAVPSYSALKESVSSQNSTDETAAETDPVAGESWVDFQRRLYRQHLAQSWIGRIVMTSTTSATPTVFDWLFADTTYQIVGYLDNLSKAEAEPNAKKEEFATKAMPDCQPFVVKFAGVVQQSLSSFIATQVAQVQGVNALRLVSPTYTTTRRSLEGTDSTSFTYTLLPNRYSDIPTPAEEAKLTDAELAALSSALQPTVTSALQSVTNAAVPSRGTPKWATEPSVSTSTSDSLAISFRASAAGESCCVALLGASTVPTAEQIVLGLDPSNQSASAACVTTDLSADTNTVTISGLTAATQYYVFCTATDAYPQWPTYMSYTITSPNVPLAAKTVDAVAGETSAAGALLLAAWIALL